MQQSPIRGYRFDDFHLDLARRRLTRVGGEPLPLSGRAFDVLALLVEQRDRMLTKREIMDAVWPRSVVEENNLTQAISALRRALGDARESPRFIVTVAGRGYQFIADAVPVTDAAIESGRQSQPHPPAVTAGESSAEAPEPGVTAGIPAGPATASASNGLAAQVMPEPAERSSTPPASPPSAGRLSRRAVLVGLAGLAAVGVATAVWRRRGRGRRIPESIAVLPFKPLISGERNEAIEVGVAELLINRLSVLPGVVVSPLSSVRSFAAPDQDPLSAGRSLRVEAIVDGHVQVRDNRVRLTARLLDVESGSTLWAGEFTEAFDDFFAMQDSLATQVVDALALSVSGETRRRLLAQGTRDAEAWQLYANGRYQLDRRNSEGMRRARGFFDAALRRDPGFALAAAGLSEAWALAGVFGLDPTVAAFTEARAAAGRALEIDESLPDGHVAMGHVVTQFDLDLPGGQRHYRKALALDPGHGWAHALMAINVAQTGHLDDALDYIRRAQSLEPAAMPFMALGGWIEYNARNFDASRRQLVRLVESVPGAALPRQFLARTLLALDDAEEAVRLLEGRNEPAPGSNSTLGRAYARVGNADAARAEIARVEADGARGVGVGFDLALIHLELGERQQALDWLERGVDDHSMSIGYVAVEPALDPLREEPRLQAVAKRIGVG